MQSPSLINEIPTSIYVPSGYGWIDCKGIILGYEGEYEKYYLMLPTNFWKINLKSLCQKCKCPWCVNSHSWLRNMKV